MCMAPTRARCRLILAASLSRMNDMDCEIVKETRCWAFSPERETVYEDGSVSHGTGRKMSRGDCKPLADGFNFAALRKSVLLPSGVEDASLRNRRPVCVSRFGRMFSSHSPQHNNPDFCSIGFVGAGFSLARREMKSDPCLS